MKTQYEIVKTQLFKKGFVSRNWCLQRYISRLSGLIHTLRAEGIKISAEYKKTKFGRDYIYKLVK